MAICDKCGRETDRVFERGEWHCRKCYAEEVLKPEVAKDFDEENAEKLADALYDDYWSDRDYTHFRREEE